jgi:uncharacterized protein (DUF1330 family)
VDVTETPAADEKIDHAVGGGAGGIGKVGSSFHNHPGVSGGVRRGCIAGFNEWTGERLLLVQFESQRHVQRALDAVDAYLAVSLRRVAIAATEECTVIEDRQVETGSCA